MASRKIRSEVKTSLLANAGARQPLLLPSIDVLEVQLASALNKLPLKNGGVSSNYQRIGWCDVHHLLRCRPVKHYPEIIEYQNRLGVVGEAATKREIKKFKFAAEKLLQAIRNLHAPARLALNLDATVEQIMQRQAAGIQTGLDFESRIQMVIVQANHYSLPDIPSNAGRGRKAATQETNFAVEIAKIFMAVTGRAPGVKTDPDSGKSSGPYLQLVMDIFEIFRVEASALVHAKAAAKSLKEEITKMKKYHDTLMQEYEAKKV